MVVFSTRSKINLDETGYMQAHFVSLHQPKAYISAQQTWNNHGFRRKHLLSRPSSNSLQNGKAYEALSVVCLVNLHYKCLYLTLCKYYCVFLCMFALEKNRIE